MANALCLLLGGTAITYYGEEIGMTDLPKELLKFEDCKDEAGKRHGVIILIFS
jgi:glycosidase